jgi:hypothetical protein
MMSLYIVGAYSTSGLEGHIFDKMPNRRDGEPEWPDYQLLFFSADIDTNFIGTLISVIVEFQRLFMPNVPTIQLPVLNRLDCNCITALLITCAQQIAFAIC